MNAWRCALLWAALSAGQQALAQEIPLDCARPESWAEQTICSDNELTEIHVRVQRAYEEKRRQLGEGAQAELVSYQRGWLRGREECRTAGDAAPALSCLKDLYGARLSQLSNAQERATVPPSDPTLIACRGDGVSWAMELGASSARLRTDTTQVLSGKFSIVPEQKTYMWRGAQTPGGGEVVALVLESACALDGNRARFPLVARVSLPGGNLLAGCCQRTPVAALREAPPASRPPPATSPGHNLGPLLSAGTQIRLRNVDGATVPLRRSARISSGNILTKVKAGITATVEQGIVQEGMNWYFIAFPRGDLKGWVMGELVEETQPSVAPDPPSAALPPAMAQPPVFVEPVAPSVAVRERWLPVRGDWWRSVVNYLPFIDACIRKAQARTARVVNLEATKDNLDIYLRDPLHQRIACTVQADGSVRARAVNMDEHFPASGPIFTRAPGAPPNPSCYSSKRVMNPKTRSAAGWLSTLKPGKRCR
ncbi:MAG: lysozyme inhibitor LprI family protein [Burkholderiales bacterium]